MAKDAKLAMHRRNQRRNELQAKRNAHPHEKCVEGLLRQKTTRHIDFAFSNFAANRASVEAKLSRKGSYQLGGVSSCVQSARAQRSTQAAWSHPQQGFHAMY